MLEELEQLAASMYKSCTKCRRDTKGAGILPVVFVAWSAGNSRPEQRKTNEITDYALISEIKEPAEGRGG
jgi:hypothetical protein